MSFQVNGVTVLDMNRTFATSAFGKTVNGQNIEGTGELQFQRGGVTADHVVGDYLLCGHTAMSGSNGWPLATFAAGATVAGSGMIYKNDNPVGWSMIGWGGVASWSATSTALDTNVNVGGTWRVCVVGNNAYTVQAAKKTPIFFARIS